MSQGLSEAAACRPLWAASSPSPWVSVGGLGVVCLGRGAVDTLRFIDGPVAKSCLLSLKPDKGNWSRHCTLNSSYSQRLIGALPRLKGPVPLHLPGAAP